MDRFICPHTVDGIQLNIRMKKQQRCLLWFKYSLESEKKTVINSKLVNLTKPLISARSAPGQLHEYLVPLWLKRLQPDPRWQVVVKTPRYSPPICSSLAHICLSSPTTPANYFYSNLEGFHPVNIWNVFLLQMFLSHPLPVFHRLCLLRERKAHYQSLCTLSLSSSCLPHQPFPWWFWHYFFSSNSLHSERC